MVKRLAVPFLGAFLMFAALSGCSQPQKGDEKTSAGVVENQSQREKESAKNTDSQKTVNTVSGKNYSLKEIEGIWKKVRGEDLQWGETFLA